MSHQIRDLQINHFTDMIFDTFTELRGDRRSGDDRNIVGGLARLNGYKIIFIGYQRDKAVETPKVPDPQGYRKCSRLIHLAETFSKPVIVFIDSFEVFSLPSSNQQQVNEALARNLEEMFGLMTPIIFLVKGECNEASVDGMCTADRIVIVDGVNYPSPGEASTYATDSELPCLKNRNLPDLGIVRMIPNDPDDVDSITNALRKTILEELDQLTQIHPEVLMKQRLHRLQNRFLGFGTSKLPSGGNSGEIFQD